MMRFMYLTLFCVCYCLFLFMSHLYLFQSSFVVSAYLVWPCDTCEQANRISKSLQWQCIGCERYRCIGCYPFFVFYCSRGDRIGEHLYACSFCYDINNESFGEFDYYWESNSSDIDYWSTGTL